MSAPAANPYQTPRAELRPAHRPFQSPLSRYLFAIAVGIGAGLASGGATAALLTFGWYQSPFDWSFGVSAGLILGALGGALAGIVLSAHGTNRSSRLTLLEGGIVGTVWAGFFGLLGSIPMHSVAETAVGGLFTMIVGGAAGVALAHYLRRKLGSTE